MGLKTGAKVRLNAKLTAEMKFRIDPINDIQFGLAIFLFVRSRSEETG